MWGCVIYISVLKYVRCAWSNLEINWKIIQQGSECRLRGVRWIRNLGCQVEVYTVHPLPGMGSQAPEGWEGPLCIAT